MSADFFRAKEAATQLLLSQRLYSLRIDATRLQYEQSIVFDSMQHFCSVTSSTIAKLTGGSDCLRDGCTFIRHRLGQTFYVVLYNQSAINTARRGFTLAHEVGHILLEHEKDGDIQEQEANCFAAQLLAPDILVHALSQRMQSLPAPQDLCEIFAISKQAAENKLRGLRVIRNEAFSRNDWLLLKKLQHLLPDSLEPYVDI